LTCLQMTEGGETVFNKKDGVGGKDDKRKRQWQRLKNGAKGQKNGCRRDRKRGKGRQRNLNPISKKDKDTHWEGALSRVGSHKRGGVCENNTRTACTRRTESLARKSEKTRETKGGDYWGGDFPCK